MTDITVDPSLLTPAREPDDAVSESVVDGAAARPRSEWSRRWRRFRGHRLAVCSLGFVVVLILLALLAPLIAPYGPTEVDYTAILQPAFADGHVLGTDVLGRDILTRLLYSLQTALIISFCAELTALALALVVGLTAGFRGGRVDQVLMAGTDIMYAFPSYLFAVILVTALGRSNLAVIAAIAVASWVTQARLVRAQVLKLRSMDFVEAGRAMGASGTTLLVRYILPGAMGPMLVATSFGIPAAIVAESGLSLLGIGVAPPTPSWGTMIIDGYSYALAVPNLLVWPMLLFALTMLAFTWVGDGIRDAFDVNEER